MKLKPKQNKRCFTVVNSSDRTHTQHIEMRPQLFKTGGRQMWALQKHKWLHLLSSFVFYLLHYKVKKDLGYCMNSSSIYKSSWFIGSEWFSSCCFFDLCKPHRMAVKLGCCHDKIENTNIRFLTQPFTLTSVKNTELSLTEPIGAHNASKPHSSAEVKADIWLDDLPKQQTFIFPASHRWSLTRVLLELLWCCRFHLMIWDHRECKCHAVLWFSLAVVCWWERLWLCSLICWLYCQWRTNPSSLCLKVRSLQATPALSRFSATTQLHDVLLSHSLILDVNDTRYRDQS